MFLCLYGYFSPLIQQVQLIRYRAAVKHLDLKAEQLETDVVLVRNDLSLLTEKVSDVPFSHLIKKET